MTRRIYLPGPKHHPGPLCNRASIDFPYHEGSATDRRTGMAAMNIERQTLIALKWASFAKLTGQIVSWAATLLVIRLLLPADYGLMAVVSVLISVLSTIAELGIGAAVVQAPSITREELAKVSGLVIIFNAATFALLLLFAPLVAWAYSEPRLTLLVQVAALQLPISAVATLPQALAQRELNFKWLAWVELTSVVVASAVTLGLAWHGAGVWALVLGSLANAAVRALMLLRDGFLRPSFRMSGVRRFLGVGGAVMFGRLAWQVIYQSDVLIGARRLGADAVGFYSVSLQLATLPMQKIMMTLNQVVLPAVARLQNETERLRRRLLEASRLLTVFSIPLSWGMSAVSPELIGVVLGSKWTAAVYPMQIISLTVPLRMITGTYATAAVGVGKVGVDVRNNILTAIVLPTSFFVGTFWGVDGMATAWLFAVPLLFVLNFARMARTVSISVADVGRATWRPIAAGAAMYFAVVVARACMAELTDLLRLPSLIGVGAIAYLAVLHLLEPGIWRELLRVWRAAKS